MKLSVIIPTCNRPESLRRCLAALARQEFPAANFEVIVVLDGTVDEPLARLSLPFRLACIQLPTNVGQSAARNTGARAASGEWLLFLDDDMEPQPGFLLAHVNRYVTGLVIFGRTVEYKTPDPRAPYYSRLDQAPTARWPDDAWLGPNCSVERHVFLDSGGYDEAVFPRCGEDIDLGFSLWSAGVGFEFAPNAVAIHHDVRSPRDLLRAETGHGGAAIALARKYPGYRRHLPLARFAKRGCLRFLICLAARSPLSRVSPRAAWLAGAVREAGGWRRLTQFLGEPLPVLLYHHVGPPSPETSRNSLTVSPENFALQLNWLLSHGYSLITPSRWLAWLTHASPLPPRPVVLTFDDGYAELGQYAFPVIARSNAGAAHFPVSGLGTWEGKAVMTASELTKWEREGIEIGGHTRTHPDLRVLDPVKLAAEVKGCFEDLRGAGVKATSFAYPFGEYSTEVRETVRQTFHLAFTCDEGLNTLFTDPLMLRRTMVQPDDTLLDLRFRVWLGWSPLNRVATWLRPRSRVRGLLRRLGLRK